MVFKDKIAHILGVIASCLLMSSTANAQIFNDPFGLRRFNNLEAPRFRQPNNLRPSFTADVSMLPLFLPTFYNQQPDNKKDVNDDSISSSFLPFYEQRPYYRYNVNNYPAYLSYPPFAEQQHDYNNYPDYPHFAGQQPDYNKYPASLTYPSISKEQENAEYNKHYAYTPFYEQQPDYNNYPSSLSYPPISEHQQPDYNNYPAYPPFFQQQPDYTNNEDNSHTSPHPSKSQSEKKLNVDNPPVVSSSPSPKPKSENNQNVNVTQQFEEGLETFGKHLFCELEKSNAKKNTIISPFSIETAIAMLRMGAKNDTSLEIDKSLGLSVHCRKELAKKFNTLLQEYTNSSSTLQMANKMYIKQEYKVQEEFKELLKEQFLTPVGAIDLADSETAAHTINTWVEKATNNSIKDLVAPNSIGVDTSLVMINAVHFKGEWLKKFDKADTRLMDFYLDDTNTIKVEMMLVQDEFLYGTFPSLDATAVELCYKKSNLCMLIILSNSRTGLSHLEEKLKNIKLSELTEKMRLATVAVNLPKFKTSFKVELADALKNLGLKRTFSGNGDFGKILKSFKDVGVPKLVHKAVIEVNEDGSEAAAASALKMTSRSNFMQHVFFANRPFVYFIKNPNNVVFFTGNFKNLN